MTVDEYRQLTANKGKKRTPKRKGSPSKSVISTDGGYFGGYTVVIEDEFGRDYIEFFETPESADKYAGKHGGKVIKN